MPPSAPIAPLKKDDALKLRDRLLTALNQALMEVHLPALDEDGKLHHEEIDGENRWAMRLSRKDLWPHVAPTPGIVTTPGLRYEVWFFQKRAEVWFALVCPRTRLPAPARESLKPWWKNWVESGTYARRYKPIDGVWLKSYPDTDGIWRSAPADDRFEHRFDKNLLAPLVTLVRDTLPGIEKALDLGNTPPLSGQPSEKASSPVEPAAQASSLAQAFQQAAAARNPLQELAEKFNAGKSGGGKGSPGSPNASTKGPRR